MKIINSRIEILNAPDYQLMLNHIEASARTCYQSEPKSDDPADSEAFISRLIKSGHHSVLEHISLSVEFVCDRGVTHELVRHRLCSFSQSSTRYCNYSKEKFGKELTFIRPCFWDEESYQMDRWKQTMQAIELAYFDEIKAGASPQEARTVLPNSLKATIVVTANLRQWRLVLGQRCAPDAHPQMQQVMLPLLRELTKHYHGFFWDMRDLLMSGESDFRERGWEFAEVKNG